MLIISLVICFPLRKHFIIRWLKGRDLKPDDLDLNPSSGVPGCVP